MKITRFQDLHADFGWRTLSFLKVETDQGVVGWTEYYEGAGNRGLTAVIRALSEDLIGADPTQVERIAARLNGLTIQAIGGINHQAVAAICNALLDIQAKSLGVPVSALFGGRIRDRLPLYWSHCVSYRVRYPKSLGVTPPRDYDDLSRIGEEVRTRGFHALKTTIVLPQKDGFVGYRPTTGESTGFPELNLGPGLVEAAERQLDALRLGAGPDVGLLIDANFFFKTEGYIRLARALERFNLWWFEVDSYDPNALADIRRSARTAIGSGEHLYARRGYKPFLDTQCLDVATVDPIWNGYLEALKIAALADTYEVNVAPHNYYGYLSDFISAHFAAAIPNFRVMETDVDAVPWRDEFYTHAPEIVDGSMIVPSRPGWGTDINEAGVRAHPPKK